MSERRNSALSPSKKQVNFADEPSISISDDSITPVKKKPAGRGRAKFQKAKTLAPSKVVVHDQSCKGTKYHKTIQVKDVLKKNNNLNLDDYRPFISQFQLYSHKMFDHQEGLFSIPTDVQDELKQKTIRANLDALLEASRLRDSDEDVRGSKSKKSQLPVTSQNFYTDREIRCYQELGKIGWKYLKDAMFNKTSGVKFQQILKEKERLTKENYLQQRWLERKKRPDLYRKIKTFTTPAISHKNSVSVFSQTIEDSQTPHL